MRTVFPLLAVFLLGLAPLGAVAEDQDSPVAEVRRAVTAAQGLDYQGVLVHALPSGVETMRLYHRSDGEGGFRERVVMLTGPARELVRDADSLWRYQPGGKRVIGGPRRGGTGIFKLQAGDLERVRKHYEISRGPRGRTAGRAVRALELRARDDQRFHYRLWRDLETDLPLRTEVLDQQGNVVESFLFAVVDPGVRPTPQQVRLRVPDHAQRVRRGERDPQAAPDLIDSLRLPRGFRMAGCFEGPGEADSYHLFYSDGLATVSVFVEAEEGGDETSGGVLRRGALHAATLRRAGYRVTILGELPGPAIQRAAASLSVSPEDGS